MRLFLCLTTVSALTALPSCHRCDDDDDSCNGEQGGDADVGDHESWSPPDDDDDVGNDGDDDDDVTCPAYGDFDWSATPAITWNAAQGSTSISAQFVPRDANCSPLLDGEFVVRPHVDGVMDPEHAGDSSGETPPIDLHLILVLDASYSMVVRGAWDKMLAAASATLQNAATTWNNRPGQLTFEIVWFNSFVFHSDGTWRVEDVATIPVPNQDTNAFTKLYSSVVVAKQLSETAFAQGIAARPQDHHQIVVFTDGDDNHSYFPNGSGAAGTTSGGATFIEVALSESIDVGAAVEAVTNHSANLTTHVIALSGQIEQKDALVGIANAGSGQFLSDPREDALGTLFSDVMKEFVSLQTISITTPLGTDQHTFELRYQGLGKPEWSGLGYSAKCFVFEAGPAAAFVSYECE